MDFGRSLLLLKFMIGAVMTNKNKHMIFLSANKVKNYTHSWIRFSYFPAQTAGLQGLTLSCDWFIAVLRCVVIGRISVNYQKITSESILFTQKK